MYRIKGSAAPVYWLVSGRKWTAETGTLFALKSAAEDEMKREGLQEAASVELVSIPQVEILGDSMDGPGGYVRSEGRGLTPAETAQAMGERPVAAGEPEPVNPYGPGGSMAEAWRRGYNGERRFAHVGSDYDRAWREGRAASKQATRQAVGDPFWRVALVRSSHSPARLIPWLCGSEKDVVKTERHRSFIRWLTPSATPEPIPMVLHCPKCGMQHIDEPKDHPLNPWLNPPHRSHLCHGCGTVWRPADVPTTGVKAVSTKGKADTWEPGQAGEPVAWRWFNSNGDQVTSWIEFKATQKESVEAQVAEAGGRIEYAYTHPAPAVPEVPDVSKLLVLAVENGLLPMSKVMSADIQDALSAYTNAALAAARAKRS